jgi:hypothetical protein
MSRHPSLVSFSDRDLREELARRLEKRLRDEAEKEWCNECCNFIIWTRDNNPPLSYNPCAKGHMMIFKLPEGYTDAMGFYKQNCRDRE